jgi:hypothetical protein
MTPILNTKIMVVKIIIKKVLNAETTIIIKMIKRRLSALTKFI